MLSKIINFLDSRILNLNSPRILKQNEVVNALFSELCVNFSHLKDTHIIYTVCIVNLGLCCYKLLNCFAVCEENVFRIRRFNLHSY